MQARYLYILVASLAAVLSARPVFAFDLKYEKSLRLDINSAIRSAAKAAEKELMSVAGPIPALPSKGDSFKSLIQKSCPGSSAEYFARAPAEIEKLNTGLVVTSLDQPIPSDLARVVLPYCVGNSLPRHPVQSGDSLWGIFEAQKNKKDGIADWTNFVDQFKNLNNLDDSQLKSLTLGTEIILPKANVEVSIPEVRIREVIQKLEVQGLEQQFEVIKSPNLGVLEADGEPSGCDFQQDSSQYAELQFNNVLNALALNAYIDEQDSEWSISESKPVVGLFDSGLEDIASPAMRNFRKKMSNLIKPEDQQVLSGYDKKFHGSGVMSVTLGGHLLTQINSIAPLIDIAPYRLIEEICQRQNADVSCGYFATVERLNFAMRQAIKPKSGVSVVNLSVSFPQAIDGFDDFLGPDKPLIVVAAGNSGLLLGNTQASYPAMLGGQDVSNLITVTGVNADGALMDKSNHSPKYVDIGAWGCEVPVLEYDEAKQRFFRNTRSGTSYAAPQVSFAAALLSREIASDRSAMTSTDIKKRLIYSADLEPSLWSYIKHGRLLNLTKAMALFSDVVEVDTGDFTYGEVIFDEGTASSVKLCANVEKELTSLRKIAKLDPTPDEPGAGRFLIYSEASVAGELDTIETQWCGQIFPNVSIRDLVSGKTTPIEMETVKDIVFASH